MTNWKVDFNDPELFGSEVAEDEDETLFASYAYQRKEYETFLDPTKRLAVVRAYKGEGKSALLRWTALRLRDFKNVATKEVFANGIAPQRRDHADDYVNLWKLALLKQAGAALGSILKFDFSDDVISLKEEAERSGFKERGFIQALLSRLKALPAAPEVAGASSPAEVLRRVAGGNDVQIWLIVDDLDENFRNIESDCERVSSALVAMRQLAAQIPELRFRTSIRPGTWAVIRRKFEALSKVDSYVIDLKWTRDELETMLSRRVFSFLNRNSGVAKASGNLEKVSARELVAVAFDDPMPWGKKQIDAGLGSPEGIVDKHRSPAVVVSSLARYRPRWMIELCKAAGARALARGQARIGLDDLTENLAAFGRTRIDDLIAEFRSQCDKIEVVLTSFTGKVDRFQTDQLVSHVRNNLRSRDVRVEGISRSPTEIELIQFLFSIGFITARRDFPGGVYEHYSFFDEPGLLAGGIDTGVTWEIPSCYRQVLQLRDPKKRMPR